MRSQSAMVKEFTEKSSWQRWNDVVLRKFAYINCRSSQGFVDPSQREQRAAIVNHSTNSSMAPIAPKKRTPIRHRIAKAGVGNGAPLQPRTNVVIDDSFSSTKKDKRSIKHSVFVSRIEKANQRDSKKRRRPSKKLITTLESLADALPELAENGAEETVVGQAKIQHKSLKSRPGALKRMEKQEKTERERFAKNMAEMATMATSSTAAVVEGQQNAVVINPPANGWNALRRFISTTMDQNPEFAKKNPPAT